ncbi:MAG: hypothetical protein CMM58_09520 [Rhodospirillaceae bacterium]|nr:hypothetical protein [Rhodospirillaceae bacterium]|tara:strand:+ start:5026 stop:5610 length:585 start_codon:yes stop_codon:yes gene_type:complete
MNPNNHLIVFAKQPKIGWVKTRLAKDIGLVNATFWYRKQLLNLLKTLDSTLPCRRHLFVTPDAAARQPTIYTTLGWEVHSQGGGDLGARMKRAFTRVGAGPRVLIGSDIPEISKQHIRTAFSELRRADAVFGPAKDGGYWLIGLSKYTGLPHLRKIRWSTRFALSDTINHFRNGDKISLLETLTDVDHGPDLCA